MLEFSSPSPGLAGSLLVAHPSLQDPNFCKSVLFVSAHDATDGAFALILNRPTLNSVADLVAGKVLSGGKDLGALMRLPVFVGGPVCTDELIFASFSWNAVAERIESRHHLSFEAAQECLLSGRGQVRAFLGYSGWSQGQLEGELAQHAWLVARPGPSVLDLSRAPLLWRETLSGFGPWFRMVAEAPDDLSRS